MTLATGTASGKTGSDNGNELEPIRVVAGSKTKQPRHESGSCNLLTPERRQGV
jgi:hypothetical protein